MAFVKGGIVARNLRKIGIFRHPHSPQYVNTKRAGFNIHFVRCVTSFEDKINNVEDRQVGDKRRIGGALAVALGSLGLALYLKKTSECKAATVDERIEKAGAPRKDLPDYRKADIIKHRSKETCLWVTYKNGVYDITEFLQGHPGGDKILLAAGGPLEPFWQMYAIHNNPEVFEILEELRIGNIHPDDLKDQSKLVNSKDPFANDPERHPALRINSPKPFNAEPPVELLIDNFVTPNELFFVRNHLPVPRVEVKNFNLEINGIGIKKPVSLKLDDLKKKFKPHTLMASVQCAGNRRSHMRKVKEVKGLNWGMCAISNAEWTGVKLSDVLQYAKADEDKINHVIFQGLDKDIEGTPYETSIPVGSAFDPRKDVLLAYEMNGKDLPVDHGYPLRVIVPGVVGARQVKWVTKIILSEDESSSHWQKLDYKTFNPSIDYHNVDFGKAEAIQEYPLQSAICEPKDGSVVEAGDEVVIRGYAWSGGGRGILRVDVSIDGGKSWHETELSKANQKKHHEWAWTLFEVAVPVPDKKGQLEIMCKATDSSHNAQPESTEGIWNFRGLIHNAWHRVNVKVQ